MFFKIQLQTIEKLQVTCWAAKMSLATLHLHVHYNEWYKCIFEGVVEWDFKEYLWKDRIACEKSRGIQLSHQRATEVSKGVTGHIHLSRKLEKFSNSMADWALQILAIYNIFGIWNFVFRHIYANCG